MRSSLAPASSIAIACALGALARAQDASPPPQKSAARLLVPAGFAVDLIDQAPNLLWPAANTCLDDGSLLVAEDRMDMPGPTDKPVDRIWCYRFGEDGTSFTRTVFSDQLYATFGIEQVDDAVYVMNMPHLTVLRDKDGDGVADERNELITDLGPPAPGWPDGFNDHIVSGIRLGLDGFLYIAVGDKGIPLAHGTDGKTLTLRGGGVIRVRPDGTGLEVVASGLRNILDVAIDERGEMFTYDNTDDGLGWWTRLSHIIPGGYYGYPWDYHDHPERMLPCMAEYGGGSGTGGLVYREAAWPPPYQGSLFFCDWADGVIRRVEVEPDGATFKVTKDEDFASAGDVKEFRPLDICESPDGRFMYVSDWAFPGWRAPDEAGRLWRIRRADDDGRNPRGMEPFSRDTNGLIAALGSPGFRRRMAAQRVLASYPGFIQLFHFQLDEEDGFKPIQLSVALAWMDTFLSEDSRKKALPHEVGALVSAESREMTYGNSSVEARLQAALASVAARRGLSGGFLDLLHEPDPRVRAKAASVLWWGNAPPEATKELIGAFDGVNDAFTRSSLRAAIQRCKAWNEVIAQLPHVAPGVQQDLLLAIRGQYDHDAVASLAELVSDAQKPGELRARVLRALSDLHRKPEPWDGKWWNIQPAKTPPPAHTVDWKGTPIVVECVRAALADRESEIRRAALECVREMREKSLLPAVRDAWALEQGASTAEADSNSTRRLILGVLAELRDEDAGPLLRNALAMPGLDDAAATAAAAIGTSTMVDLLVEMAQKPEVGGEQRASCVAALGRIGDERGASCVEAALLDRDASVREAACTAWAALRKTAAEPALIRALNDADPKARRAAVNALGRLELPTSVPAIHALVRDAELQNDALLALARRPDERAMHDYLLGLRANDLAVRDGCRRALATLREPLKKRLEGMALRGELGGAVVAELQAIYRGAAPVIEWTIAGPYPREDEVPELEKTAFDYATAAFALPEDESRNSTGESKFSTQRGDPKHGHVDLRKVLTDKSEQVAYAFAAIDSSRDREAKILAGSDDQLGVWVNGELVHEYTGVRAWSADEDRFPARLRSGSNAIILRIGQGAGDWGFNLKVSGDETGPLFERAAARVATLEDYRSAALTVPGDPARGSALFRDLNGAMCMRCHTVDGEGEQVGPDLSDVGKKYAREELVTSVLEPSKRIAEGYKAVSVLTRDEEMIFGQIRSQDALEVVLIDTSGKLQHIPRTEIEELRASSLSVMPEGLATLMTTREFADLVTYLANLRSERPAAPVSPVSNGR